MAKAKCNHNCFECIFYDCIEDEVSISERLEQDNRDRNYTTFGTAVKSKSKRGKRKYNINTY